MSIWTWLEYVAWAVSAALAGWMLVDTIRVKSGFEDPLLSGGQDRIDMDDQHGADDRLR